MFNELQGKQKIRCAIYTRKSHEEGLDQDFNSLDAQRLSAENYIASQAGQGWILIETHYDDGGYSGGNMERPALQRLFSDIKEGLIDCIVVYKIDRLTRSLLDFAKIIELLDSNKVSFVSVTQSFNTSNSMGRLMLNVLLSFAQYERELTSERIRDKFDASKKKGIWMGGCPALGYDVKDRQLLVNETEAKTVKLIFESFLESNSIIQTTRNINQMNCKTKAWTSQSGKIHKGRPFNKNLIRRILQNPVYAGKISHKNQNYAGKHTAIIDEEIFNKAQEIFKKTDPNKIRIPTSRASQAPLLKGIIHCKCCNKKMIPSYTGKNGKKYRYYICDDKTASESCEVRSISASEIEGLVINHVLNILKQPQIITNAIITNQNHESTQQITLKENEIIEYFQSIESVWNELFPIEQARIISLVIEKVAIGQDGIGISIQKEGLNFLAQEVSVN